MATGSSASVTTLLGNLSGTITGGDIGNVLVAGTMSGHVFASTGSIGAMVVLGDISSGSSIAAGSGDLDILCLGNVAGNITASTNITLSAAGTVSATVTTWFGNIVVGAGGSVSGNIDTYYGDLVVQAGGDISSLAFYAEGNLALSAGGKIASNQIFAAGNIGVRAAGAITTPLVVSMGYGAVTEIAGGRLNTNATSSVAVTLAGAVICNSFTCVAGVTQSVGGGACFAAGTRVLLKDGRPMRLRRWRGGWVIWSVPEDDPTAAPVVRRIVRVFRRPATRIFEVEIAGHTLRTTARHRFYVRHRGWVEAGELLPGDLVQTPTKEYLKVTRAEQTNDFEPVYNFEVDRDHTYFVALGEGGPGVLVHNDTCGPVVGSGGHNGSTNRVDPTDLADVRLNDVQKQWVKERLLQVNLQIEQAPKGTSQWKQLLMEQWMLTKGGQKDLEDYVLWKIGDSLRKRDEDHAAMDAIHEHFGGWLPQFMTPNSRYGPKAAEYEGLKDVQYQMEYAVWLGTEVFPGKYWDFFHPPAWYGVREDYSSELMQKATDLLFAIYAMKATGGEAQLDKSRSDGNTMGNTSACRTVAKSRRT